MIECNKKLLLLSDEKISCISLLSSDTIEYKICFDLEKNEIMLKNSNETNLQEK